MGKFTATSAPKPPSHMDDNRHYDTINENVGGCVLAFFKLILTLLLNAATWTWCGYVLMYAWAWFVVTTFGIQPLTLPEAIGLCVVAHLFVDQYVWQENVSQIAVSIVQLIRVSFLFLIAWIIHAYYM